MANDNVQFPFMLRRGRYGAQWPGPENPQDSPRGRAWIASKRRINNADPAHRRTYGWFDEHHHQGRFHHPGWDYGELGGYSSNMTNIGGPVGPDAHTSGGRGASSTRGGGKGGKRTLRAADGKQAPRAARRGGGGGGGGRGSRGASSSS